MKSRWLLSVLVVCLALPFLTYGAVPPERINYQAVLRDDSGIPENGQFDMIFRFYDANVGGAEILVDEHLAGISSPVTVVDGLFNVRLGAGNVIDGAGVFPEDPYDTLARLFRDFTGVFVEVEISPVGAGTFETLTPRVRVVSAAYALNASNLAGRSPDEFLDTTAIAQTKIGDLGASDVYVNGGSLYFSQGAHFNNASTGFAVIKGGDDATAIFDWLATNDAQDGVIRMNGGGELDLRAGNGEFIFRNALSLQDVARLAPDGDLRIKGSARIDGNLIQFDSGPIIDDDGLQLTVSAESVGKDLLLRAGDSNDDASIFLNGIDNAGQIEFQATDFLWRNSSGLTRATLDDLGTLQIDGDLEVLSGKQILVTGGVLTDYRISGDNLDVLLGDSAADMASVPGDLQVDGVKNFVQNHPFDPGLSVVYTALEGDEAGTYTRGSGRLVDGVARIALGESFAWTTNPDIGLTAHVTPRGPASLYVASLTTKELIVRRADGGDGAVDVDYVVNGLRIGYEAFDVVQRKRRESFVPTDSHFEMRYAGREQHRELSAIERFRAMTGHEAAERSARSEAAQSLRAGIGELDFEAEELRLTAQREGGRELPARTARPRLERPGDESIETPKRASPSQGDTADIYARSFRPSARGIATLVDVEGHVEVGDVVALHPDLDGRTWLAREEADPLVLGVAAIEPGVVLGSEASGLPVVTSGIVEVKVDAGFGAIRPGDLLTASPTAGHAMRAQDVGLAGTILGKALENLEAGTGTIRVLLTLR